MSTDCLAQYLFNHFFVTHCNRLTRKGKMHIRAAVLTNDMLTKFCFAYSLKPGLLAQDATETDEYVISDLLLTQSNICFQLSSSLSSRNHL